MQEIDHGIFIETYYTGVTLGAIILPLGTILIDAPLRIEDARSWRAALINQGGSTNRLLVNLDAHPDRTLGARALECTILSHQKTAHIFRSRPSVFKGQNADSGSEWEIYNDAVGTRWAMPDITFTQRVSFHWGPPDVILEYHPGTTAGAIWALVPDSRIVFVGDAVLLNQPPFLANADIPSWLESLQFLNNSYRDYRIVSGRGSTVPNEAVQAQIKTLKLVVKGLERLARRNASPEATENLIPGLLANLEYPTHMEEQYAQRLRYGLSIYYSRHYRSHETSNQVRLNESDS